MKPAKHEYVSCVAPASDPGNGAAYSSRSDSHDRRPPGSEPCHGYLARLQRDRAGRLAEDDRLVCMERARILEATRAKYEGMPRIQRQAAVIGDLCAQITPVIEPEDMIVGRMPEVMPTCEEEAFVEAHPELFCEPGVPGWLDSMLIYVPDWGWLVRAGLGGIAAEAEGRLDGCDAKSR